MINSYISVLVISECTIKRLNVCTPFVVFKRLLFEESLFLLSLQEGLLLHQLAEEPLVFGKELGVAADLHHTVLVQHSHSVCALNGGETVSNDQHGTVVHQPL